VTQTNLLWGPTGLEGLQNSPAGESARRWGTDEAGLFGAGSTGKSFQGVSLSVKKLFKIAKTKTKKKGAKTTDACSFFFCVVGF